MTTVAHPHHAGQHKRSAPADRLSLNTMDQHGSRSPRRRLQLYRVSVQSLIVRGQLHITISNDPLDYYSRAYPWVADVLATTIRQAYWLMAHQQASIHDGPGITALLHRDGACAGWPWNLPEDLNFELTRERQLESDPRYVSPGQWQAQGREAEMFRSHAPR